MVDPSSMEYPKDISNTVTMQQKPARKQSIADKIKAMLPGKKKARQPEDNPFMEQLKGMESIRGGQPMPVMSGQELHDMPRPQLAIPVPVPIFQPIRKTVIPNDSILSAVDQLRNPEKWQITKFIGKACGIGFFATGTVLIYNELPGHLGLVIGIICVCLAGTILIAKSG